MCATHAAKSTEKSRVVAKKCVDAADRGAYVPGVNAMEDGMNTTWKIEADGFFFRAVDAATGWASSVVTSPSQAGLIIERKAGKDAHRAAAAAFLAAQQAP